MPCGVLDPSYGATTPWMLLLTLPFVLYGIFSPATSDPEEIVRRSDTRLEQGGTSERPEEVLQQILPILITVLG